MCSPEDTSQVLTDLVPYLLRIPEVFEALAGDILQSLGVAQGMRLGSEYHLVKLSPAVASAVMARTVEVAPLIQWCLRVQHSWPCHPQKMEGFIEKAAQTLWRKFGTEPLQGIFMGQLHPSSPSPYYKSMASNLRGRTLQLFPQFPAGTAEEQEADGQTLFCLVGKEGLYAGVQSPMQGNGWHAGGTKFITQQAEETISRAGAKVAEALHYLRMYAPPFPDGSHWVELGASPGGMTSELLARGQRVTAVDRAALDGRLNGRPGLSFVRGDVMTFQPRPGAVYDAILSDLNGPALDAMRAVLRLVPYLRAGGSVIYTLKLAGAETLPQILELSAEAEWAASQAGLQLLARTHLTYNRRELTLFFQAR